MDAAIVEIYRLAVLLEAGHGAYVVLMRATVTNGPTFSPRQEFMYHTDTGVKTIYRFDLSLEGELSSKKEVWLKFTGRYGITGWDDDGCRRLHLDRPLGRFTHQPVVFSPDAKLDREIRLPAPQITSIDVCGA